MLKLPSRTLADWTPDVGLIEDWLARWEAAGWVPEHPWGGVEVVIDGREVIRWAMIGVSSQPEAV
jgi:hypothetical protein